MRLWYNPYSKSYILSVPTQHVTGADIYECMDDTKEDHICVAEIHSHNRYHAFFSSVDDEYEKGNKIYAVMGNILDSKPSMAVRAGTRGYYTDIEWNDFVESDTASSIVNGQVDVLSQMLYDISRERIIA